MFFVLFSIVLNLDPSPYSHVAVIELLVFAKFRGLLGVARIMGCHWTKQVLII